MFLIRFVFIRKYESIILHVMDFKFPLFLLNFFASIESNKHNIGSNLKPIK